MSPQRFGKLVVAMSNLKGNVVTAGFHRILIITLSVCAGCSFSGTQSPATGNALDPNATSSTSRKSAPQAVTTSLASAVGPRPDSGNTNVAKYRECPVYTAGDYFNANVAGSPIDPHSAQYIASVEAAGDTTGFYLSAGIQHLNSAKPSTPKVTVHQKVTYHTFPGPFPFLPSYQFEGTSDSDDETLLINPPNCVLYEAFEASYEKGILSAFSGRIDDLWKKMPILPNDTPGSSASGLPHFPGMVKWSEIQSGSINHALYVSAWADALCNCYTTPASATDGLPYIGPASQYEMPYGAHIRLKASFDVSKFGRQSRIIANALKWYGAYIGDTGGHFVDNNAIFSIDDATNPSSWDGPDLSALNSIKFSDFDVLRITSVTQN